MEGQSVLQKVVCDESFRRQREETRYTQQLSMMLLHTDGKPLKTPLRALSALVFLLLLTHHCRGQSQLIGSYQPIVANFEAVRGPGDLYTVSSRVTVEKRPSNSFTCRVQHHNTTRTTQTQIHFPDDFFKLQSRSSSVIIGLAVSLAVCILLLLAVSFFFLWREHIFKTKRKHSDEGQFLNEGERGQLMKPDAVQMEALKGNIGKKSKPRNQSEQQLLEEQRRKDAEKEVQTLEEQLQNKKKEVASKESELQDLHAEKQRDEKELQSLKGALENKNREFSKKEELQKKKDKAEQEVENLKKKLETQQEKTDTKTKEVEVKEAEVQQLQEEGQRMETSLQTLKEEVELKEITDEELKKAKSQLDSKDAEIIQLKRHTDALLADIQTLKDEKKKSEDVQKELEATRKEDKEQADTRWRNTDEELMNAQGQLNSKEEEISRLKIEFEEKLQEEKRGREEAQRKLKEEVESKFQAGNCEGSDHSPSVEPPLPPNAQTSDPAFNIEFDRHGKCIRLMNTSTEDKQLGIWKLDLKVNNNESITYTFTRPFKLKAGRDVTMWVKGHGRNHTPTELKWKDLKSWSSGDKLQVVLFDQKQEIQYDLCVTIP
ncbi:hypothetical protein CgunFtcFv8_006019 [Champsocephalus gunnari]|uniref:LTD domain-containing protein n=1 Tax=Champsocephalus gunnari TaxID=52237 RepID=A0AAN8GUX1_CHAGU|nr:hypothetical protein CgunFtcFv8_006019 [Champsocephalus gunnari]